VAFATSVSAASSATEQAVAKNIKVTIVSRKKVIILTFWPSLF